MREFVRVKDPDTGHEYTTTTKRAERAGLRVLDKDAVDAFGAPLAAKHNITPRKATKADEKKES